MTRDDAPEEVVTVVRLVPLGRAEGASGESAIVASSGRVCLRTEGDDIYLVGRHGSTLGRLKAGDIVHWGAEPFGVAWLAERDAGDADKPGDRLGNGGEYYSS